MKKFIAISFAVLAASFVCGCAMLLADGRERELRSAPGVAIEIPTDVATGAEGGAR